MCQKDTRTVQSCRWSQLGRILGSKVIKRQNTFVGSLKSYWIFCSTAQECVVNQLIWRNCDWAVPEEEGKLHSMFCFVKIVLPQNKSCRSSVVHQSISIFRILKDNFRRPYLTNEALLTFCSVLDFVSCKRIQGIVPWISQLLTMYFGPHLPSGS